MIPPWPERLLARALPDPLAESLLGDMAEQFETIRAAKGSAHATRWYYAETVRTLVALRHHPSRQQTPIPGDPMMTSLLSDLRYAARTLRRRPGFMALTLFTLALGIGATTAIFSAVNPILFQPLPYPDANRVMTVWERDAQLQRTNWGYESFADVAARSRTFVHLAAISGWQPIFTGGDKPDRLVGQGVTPGYFKVLGTHLAMGRDFTDADNVRGTPQVTIVSHAFWRSHLHADSNIIGRTLMMSGTAYTVIGILPADFENLGRATAQVWRTLRYDSSMEQACRTCRHIRVVGRLTPTATASEADKEINALWQQMKHDHPSDYPTGGAMVVPAHTFVTEAVRPALLAVLVAVALVLLVAVVNVTNLMLARGAQRRAEFAVRGALGASRRRVVRQLATESLLLATAGGALGLIVAFLGVRALRAMAPGVLPRLQHISIDPTVLLFAIGITLITGLVAGLVPAFQLMRPNFLTALRSGTRTTGGTSRVRQVLVVSEVVLALLLLIGAGLLWRSMHSLLAVDPGINTRNLLTMQIQLTGAQYNDPGAGFRYFEQARTTVLNVPGVTSAAFTSQLPLSGDFDSYGITPEHGGSTTPEDDPGGFRYAVSPGYLETMGIRVLRGRGLEATDDSMHPRVVLLTESLARKLWPNPAIDPIGQRISMGDANRNAWRTVVGLVTPVRQTSLSTVTDDAIYLPEVQWIFEDNPMTLVVRSARDPAGLVADVQQALWTIDRNIPMLQVATMQELLDQSSAQRRFILVLFQLFGITAMLLAAAGLYGLLTGMVTERFHELGIRASLGATRARLLGMVLQRGFLLIGIGVIIGVGAALVLSQVITNLLFGIPANDPLTFVGGVAVLGLISFAACVIPAWRAARVDPVRVLRGE